jgi:DNA replication ATP-dependent helicase Dna2
MHVDIAKFPKQYFYNDELKAGTDTQRLALAHIYQEDNGINKVLSASRTIFISSKTDLNSKINTEEAKLTVALLEQIARNYGEDFKPEQTVGVITPFRAQIANIRNELRGRFADVTIDTVERFQGSERDIIILSYAIKSTSQLKAIQSINDEGIDRKLNVAITRAKDQLIILGSEEVLNKDDTFKKLIDFIKENKGYKINPLKLKTVPNNLF